MFFVSFILMKCTSYMNKIFLSNLNRKEIYTISMDGNAMCHTTYTTNTY